MPETQGAHAAEMPGFHLQTPEDFSYPVTDDPWPILKSAASKTVPRGDVLLLGRDISLQRTRASLLERVAFRCHLAEGADELLCMAPRPFDVIVFCHTLPVEEACHAVEHARLRFSKAVILRLARYVQAEEACFEHLLIFPTPSEFVAMVQHLSGHAGCTA